MVRTRACVSGDHGGSRHREVVRSLNLDSTSIEALTHIESVNWPSAGLLIYSAVC